MCQGRRNRSAQLILSCVSFNDSKIWEDGKLRQDEKHGKRRQVSFRIGPVCEDRLARAAALFNMKPCEYVKAVLYKDLGIYDEPPDRRRLAWLKQKRQLQREDEDASLFCETSPNKGLGVKR